MSLADCIDEVGTTKSQAKTDITVRIKEISETVQDFFQPYKERYGRNKKYHPKIKFLFLVSFSRTEHEGMARRADTY